MPSSPTAATAVERVRVATASRHVALERRLAAFAWLESVDAYAAMLERLLAFHRRLEPALTAAAAGIGGLELDRRAKVPLLESDLARLRRAPGVLAAPARMPRVDSLPRALGALYVVEGATLGGKVIEREVGRRLGLDRASGTAFFGAYGRDAARRWRAFCAVLDREGARHAGGEIEAAACETFDVLDAWLR